MIWKIIESVKGNNARCFLLILVKLGKSRSEFFIKYHKSALFCGPGQYFYTVVGDYSNIMKTTFSFKF